ncbi:hypothetical protein B5C34_05665 [Pacificimonas flava]|uniref:PRC-barrel protein n=2 Tax=Pacificimonas TaxID=1960290 RepID=A0A219B5E6_9SPHN|nr:MULTISPECIES: hypothetical protein [Pacificimonas]MBZ6377291.1 hypothetical protein [Pacificimonas aurantium]OWV32998.1 hypothetical protein B5C34_05665 [Pacificimonas flava]
MQQVIEWSSSIIGMVAALMIALRISSRVTGWGFVLFLVGSVLWIVAGLREGDNALAAQNVVLFGINLLGIYRYLIKHEEA